MPARIKNFYFLNTYFRPHLLFTHQYTNFVKKKKKKKKKPLNFVKKKPNFALIGCFLQ